MITPCPTKQVASVDKKKSLALCIAPSPKQNTRWLFEKELGLIPASIFHCERTCQKTIRFRPQHIDIEARHLTFLASRSTIKLPSTLVSLTLSSKLKKFDCYLQCWSSSLLQESRKPHQYARTGFPPEIGPEPAIPELKSHESERRHKNAQCAIEDNSDGASCG